MILIVNPRFLNKRFRAITLWPFVILRYQEDRGNAHLINHEKIHLKQQLELFIILFYIWYFIEYIIGLIKYKNMEKAYYNISFEKEAYANDFNLNYLNNRPSYNFFRYLK